MTSLPAFWLLQAPGAALAGRLAAALATATAADLSARLALPAMDSGAERGRAGRRP